MSVVIRIARCVAPAIERTNRDAGQRRFRAAQPVRPVVDVPNSPAPNGRRAIALALQRFETAASQGDGKSQVAILDDTLGRRSR
jgi:uncharacterized protein (DUF1501 family)